ncbi:hypothetical protein ARMGADRAFT_161748 [Armillaria gallica]|uniref:Secreted protein n=1 Tax=Armillaria gallica TaxID=47427 RepID=A0A2H3DW24_ARMGA|nr:hypothetical protein ARMGADRAFT_161748 [Armillaria gallica]
MVFNVFLLQAGPVLWPALTQNDATQRLRQLDVTSTCSLLRPRYVLGRLHPTFARVPYPVAPVAHHQALPALRSSLLGIPLHPSRRHRLNLYHPSL